MSKKVAVIGAGVAGVNAAYFLVKKGFDVTVYEQDRYPALRCSYANSGQLSVSNSDVWTTWPNVFRGLKWMFTKDAPFLIRPSFSWAKLKWLLGFIYNASQNNYRKHTEEFIKLGLEARYLRKQIAAEEGIEFDYTDCGIVHTYKTDEFFNDAKSAKEIYDSMGVEWELLDKDGVKRVESTINTTDIIGGVWTPSDGTGDIHKYSAGLAKVLEEKYGVKFVFDTKVDDLNELTSKYDAVVVSNGVGSTTLAKSVGDSLPIYPVKGYSVTFHLDEESEKYAPLASLMDSQAKITTCRLGNRFRVGGTAELDGENYDIRRDRIDPLIKWTRENFPNMNTKDYTVWACLRPMTPRMLPIVEQSKRNKKVFYNCGHGHLGWTTSPATARQTADMLSSHFNG